MPLKDLLKKKDKIKDDDGQAANQSLGSPEFTFKRSDTNTEEIIHPPSFTGEAPIPDRPHLAPRRPSRFRSASSTSIASIASRTSNQGERRLSQRLHLRSHSYASSQSSVNIPTDLPSINDGSDDVEEKEAKWEERATILAKGNPLSQSGTPASEAPTTGMAGLGLGSHANEGVQTSKGGADDAKGDENIQEAIRLHEAGDLERSTAMFGQLANPSGANDALSQVLYGLALRHGWGCPQNPALAITYLSAAASNSAAIESSALASGIKKGGAAKGELVLAIFELANCFRHGWGVSKDPFAAKQYYETAANLGDTDAMNEVGWCYVEGFGCKKDKVSDLGCANHMGAQRGSSSTLSHWCWPYNLLLPRSTTATQCPWTPPHRNPLSSALPHLHPAQAYHLNLSIHLPLSLSSSLPQNPHHLPTLPNLATNQ
ncbi:MAG: hypothetical protein M1830_004199 [Pleopsidium flavum]|nr:MAG: hypothetical protein M1830_004199 [Pleopsidium flavum]